MNDIGDSFSLTFEERLMKVPKAISPWNFAKSSRGFDGHLNDDFYK